MEKLLFLIILLGIGFICTAQKDNSQLAYPEVGKPCPDFVIQNIQYYSKNKASLADFRGKWLLLDFWSKSCGACIASFPHINEIQQELGDKVQVMMVAIEDPQRQIEQIYARYRAKENLLMPCAFDSNLARRFDYLVTPKTVLIDDKGIVQCLTSTLHLNEMRSFLAGNRPTLARSYRMHEAPDAENTDMHANKLIPFDFEKPFAMYGNGAVDSDFLFRSILTRWKPGINTGVDNSSIRATLNGINPTAFFVLGANLIELYFYAYFGTPYVNEEYYGDCYNRLVLELTDSSLFSPNYKTGENVFCYSVNLPRQQATVTKVQETMQIDLKNCFGFTASVETRKCPCWSVIATEEGRKKLKAKGGLLKHEGIYGLNYHASNVGWEGVFKMIRRLNDNYFIFDSTGIKGNVDINLDCENCILSDVNDLKKALRANGLDLIATEKSMQVIVVRNPK